MNGLSLFSGIGGLDLAFEWAGGTIMAMCEIDPYCQKVLRKHWPNVPIFDDIHKLSKEVIENEGTFDEPTVDIIYGGFPCQPFSVAGKQKGQNDTRYLWPEFSRLVGEIKPRWIVAENVPGILRIAADDVCRDLERQGYYVGIWDFEAAAVGALHRRERIFFVAHSGCSLWQRSFKQRTFPDETTKWTAHKSQRPSCSFVPDSNKIRCDLRGLEGQGVEWQQQAFNQTDSGCETLTNSGCSRCKEQCKSCGLQERYSFIGGCRWWKPEPRVDRVVNGIPHRVDRLKALGNAVVPQQAYPVFKAIIEADEQIQQDFQHQD